MIRGNLVVFKPIEVTDLENYHRWINDEETNQWRGLYHPTSREDALKWIEAKRQPQADKLNLSIYSTNGKHIGFIGLQAICPRSRRAELWIYIGDKEYWGKGFGEDSARTLCKYAFEQMNLYRIWLECNPDFTQVTRCYEKVGFKQEGILRHAYYRDGAFRDTCIMGLLRSEFLPSSAEES
ncbi:GNAT family N-acetyltransferase [bacterium]|nr:GNAT family N-acetyltransferase [bacterium]